MRKSSICPTLLVFFRCKHVRWYICLIPVPKTPRPRDLKDYRPVAMTSHIMKTLERLILEQLRPMVQPLLDPLQFAYQPRLGVEDAIIYLLNRVYIHLDKQASTVRIMFFDFWSAFDTIRPALLAEKLTAMQVDAPLVSWMVDYLTGKPQYVRLGCCMSDILISNTGGSTRDRPLSLLFHSLYHRLQLLYRDLPSSKMFWWLCCGWMYYWWRWEWV